MLGSYGATRGLISPNDLGWAPPFKLQRYVPRRKHRRPQNHGNVKHSVAGAFLAEVPLVAQQLFHFFSVFMGRGTGDEFLSENLIVDVVVTSCGVDRNDPTNQPTRLRPLSMPFVIRFYFVI